MLEDAAEREATLRDLMHVEATQPFDLAAGPLIRAAVLRLASDEHVLLVTMHHIVSDGWSMDACSRVSSVLLYAAFAQGRPSPLPELRCNMRTTRCGSAAGCRARCWSSSCRTGSSNLPVRRACWSFRPIGRGRRCRASAARGCRSRCRRSCRRRLPRWRGGQGATPYMVLLAAFQLLLSRWSGQDDMVVGSPIAGRTERQTEGLIGFFVNTLVMRTDVADDPSFAELLARVKEAALGAYAHQDIPFEKLVEQLQPQRDLSRQPLFQVMFALQNVPQQTLELPGLGLRAMELAEGTAKFDLFLELFVAPDSLYGAFEYATDLFERSTIERLLSSYVTLAGGRSSRSRSGGCRSMRC